MRRYDPNQINSREALMALRATNEARYTKACHNLLSVVIFTAINILLLVTNSDTYFLFSAAIPRTLVDLGMYLCGKYPAEYYGGDISGYSFLSDTVFIALIAGAVLILGIYLLCWYLGKKGKFAWLIVALVLFTIDSILFFFIYTFDSSMLIDLVFRIWIFISLASGISAHFALKKAPTDLPTTSSYTEFDLTPSAEEIAATETTDTPNTDEV